MNGRRWRTVINHAWKTKRGPSKVSAMREFTFTDDDLKAIAHDRYHDPHPLVQRKMEVLWLKSHDLTHAQIPDLAGVSLRTVQRYLDEYLKGGLKSVRRSKW